MASTDTLVEEAIQNGYVSGLETGKIEPRLEIDEFILDKHVLNLFLLALIELQQKDYNDPWSWFQIAGIHGRPFSSWDKVSLGPQTDESKFAGYCAHSSVTFPTWHRPYVAMLEQSLYREMVKKANEYRDPELRQRYREAASRFRFPYWDPCIPRSLTANVSHSREGDTFNLPNEFGVPTIVSSQTVYVRFPENPNELSPVRNPLFQYDFPEDFHHPKNPNDFWSSESQNALLENPSFKGTLRTVRAPDEKGETDDGYINDYVRSHLQSDIGTSLYKVLTAHQKWINFSNNVYDNEEEARQARKNINYIDHTLEGFHDNVHVFLGQGKLGIGRRQERGSGHIGNPAYAAFDPMFWLHHCNVDRITALWQAQQDPKDPESWWEETAAGEGSWTFNRGSMQKPSDALAPFRKSPKGEGDEFWSSDDVRDWRKYGYTYQGKFVQRGSSGENELATFSVSPTETKQEDLNSFINQFYGWMELPTDGYPSLIGQFYPIDISQVEALTGQKGPDEPCDGVPSHPERIPQGIPPNPVEIDYSVVQSNLIERGQLRQWDLHILAEKFRANGSYQIFVFLGPFNANAPDTWPREPNLVGINGIFSNTGFGNFGRRDNPQPPAQTGCDNCETQASAGLTVMDVIPLTRHLIKWIMSKQPCPPRDPGAITCDSLEPVQVSRFLRKNLHWRVADMNLNEIKGVDFVKVSAVDRMMHLPKTYKEKVRFGDQTRRDDPMPHEHEKAEPENEESGCCGLRCSIM